MCCVVANHQEEALEVTGHSNAEQAAHAVLNRPCAKTRWCVVKQGSKGAVLVTKSPQHVYQSQAIEVSTQLVRA